MHRLCLPTVLSVIDFGVCLLVHVAWLQSQAQLLTVVMCPYFEGDTTVNGAETKAGVQATDQSSRSSREVSTLANNGYAEA